MEQKREQKPAQARRHESPETPAGELHTRVGRVVARLLSDKADRSGGIQSRALEHLAARAEQMEASVREYVRALPVIPAAVLQQLRSFLRGKELEAGTWSFTHGWRVIVRVRSAEDEVYLARLSKSYDKDTDYFASAMLLVSNVERSYRFPAGFGDRVCLEPEGGAPGAVLNCCSDPQVLFFAKLSSTATYRWHA